MDNQRLFIVLLALLSLPASAAEDVVCSINASDGACATVDEQATGTLEQTLSIPPANDSICIVYFYGDGCSKCAEIKPFIEDVERRYGERVNLDKFEVYRNLENYRLYNKFCSIQNIPLEERGIPLVGIGDTFFMGTKQIEDGLEPAIEDMLSSGERNCPLEGEISCHLIPAYNRTDVNPLLPDFKKLTLPVIVVGGFIDGINPCAFAVLIFLLTFLVEVSGDKRRMVKAGVAYILAVYVSYFLAGLGLLSVIQYTGLSVVIKKAAGVIAVFVGVVNVKDFFWYGRGLTFKIPESKKATIEQWVHKANIPAALVLGFLVSMFELPCTGGIYLAILALLSSSATDATAVYYLLIYNLMFVLPLILILAAVYSGMKASKLESFRQAKKNWMKLLMGTFLIALGVGLLGGWF